MLYFAAILFVMSLLFATLVPGLVSGPKGAAASRGQPDRGHATGRLPATDYYSGNRWRGDTVSWGESIWSPPPSWMPIIGSAAARWSLWSALSLTTSPGGDATGTVAYVPFSEYDDPRWRDAWGITAMNLSPKNGQRYLVSTGWLYFNSEKQWKTDGTGDFHPYGDVYAVALHEWGHWVRLLDGPSPSIMCSDCVLDGGLRSISQHDRQSVQAVYPGSGGGWGWGTGNVRREMF